MRGEIGASLGQGLGWKTREKKNNTARNNSLSLSKKQKERKNVERNKKKENTSV